MPIGARSPATRSPRVRSGALLVGVAVLVAVLAGAVLLSGAEQQPAAPSLPSRLADEPRKRAAAQATIERFAAAYGGFAAGRTTVDDLRRAGASRELADQLRRAGERVPPGLASARFEARHAQVYDDPVDPERMVGNVQLVDQDGTRLPLSVVLAQRDGRWEVVELLAGGDDL